MVGKGHNMDNITGYAVAVIGALFCLGLWLGIIIRFAGDRFGKVRSAEAVVIAKHKAENVTYSKWQSLFPRKSYTIVFDISGSKKSFDVSEFSYNGYQKGQRGTLTYRGRNIINFKTR